MIRTKGEAGTGDVVEAVRHMRSIMSEIMRVHSAREDELYVLAKEMQAPLDMVRQVHELGKLPVPNLFSILAQYWRNPEARTCDHHDRAEAAGIKDLFTNFD